MSDKLKTTQVKPTRLRLLASQGMRCALCGLELTEEEAVLDHDHKSGLIRATLHRGCNSLLGKVENNARRYRVNLDAFTRGIGAYLELHKEDQTGLLHPSHGKPKKRRVKRP